MDESVFLFEFSLIGQRGLALVIDILHPVAHHLNQCLGQLMTGIMHAHAMSLHHGRLAIDIDDQSGQMVALAMHQPVSVVAGIVGNADGLPHGECRLETGMPEGIIDGDITEREYTHRDRPHLEMSDGNKRSAMSVNLDGFSLFYIFWHVDQRS